jgi:hypothetical protein
MNNRQSVSAVDQGAARQRWLHLGRVFIVIFLGTMVAVILAMLAFSASGCFLSHAIRCFSISRDLIGVSLMALKMWSLPAFVAALLVTMVLQFQGFVVWWNILIATFISAFGTSWLARAPVVPDEVSLLFVAGLILFAGSQVSLLISNRLGKSST